MMRVAIQMPYKNFRIYNKMDHHNPISQLVPWNNPTTHPTKHLLLPLS